MTRRRFGFEPTFTVISKRGVKRRESDDLNNISKYKLTYNQLINNNLNNKTAKVEI